MLHMSDPEVALVFDIQETQEASSCGVSQSKYQSVFGNDKDMEPFEHVDKLAENDCC